MNKYIVLLVSLFFSTSLFAEQVSIDVLDATIKDKRISGAQVLLQQPGQKTLSTITDENGKAMINSDTKIVPEAMLIIKKTGFSDLVAKCPCDGLTYAISPIMKNLDGMRIVLTWGSTPADIDAHLIYPNNHVYYSHQNGDNADLDVDDRDGYGPETITIRKKKFGQSYTYAVQNYTDLTSITNRLSNSNARVFVYVGQSLVRTYDVPRDRTGNVWQVFRLNPNGDFEDINTISNYNEAGDKLVNFILNNASQPQPQPQTATASSSGSTYNPTLAKDFNKKGEKAYHQGDLSQAISYYHSAIENDENYSQAYSNLGLAYQKQGNIAEAIWANRKAIALATGANANNVKASSYFNIAKIYENSEQYADALQHYELANEQKPNEVYQKAITRVRNKL